MNTLYIVIPAYNEVVNIEMVVAGWHAVVERVNIDNGNELSRLVVVDDGSKDDTFAKLQELQTKYKFLDAQTKPNGGHGDSILWLYNYALEAGADFIFQTDSDGQTVPDEFWAMWDRRSDFDFQCGWRKFRNDGLSRIFVTTVLRLVVLLQFRVWALDANTPFRLMTAESLRERLAEIPEHHNLANVLMTVGYIKHRKRGVKMRYIPITFRQRQGGENSINFKKIVAIGKKAVRDFGRIAHNKYSGESSPKAAAETASKTAS